MNRPTISGETHIEKTEAPAGTGTVVIVNSKIVVSENPFSYTPIRSIYSVEERYEQTLETIRSVRRHLPGSHLLFVDNSVLPEAMRENLRGLVETFLNPADDADLRQDTDVTPTKALGELAHLRYATQALDGLGLEWSQLFKLCGRYVLSDVFDYSLFNNERNQFKVNTPLTKYKRTPEGAPKDGVRDEATVGPMTCYFTSFYKIARRHYAQYLRALEESYQLFKHDARYSNEPLEMVLCDRIQDKEAVEVLGITINAAVETWVEDI